MGRKPSVNLNLPKGMRARKRQRQSGKTVTYYYYEGRNEDGKRVEIPLGKDYPAAVREWAKLECAKIPKHAAPNFPQAAARYRLEVIPRKQPKTQRDNHYQLDKLLEFFGGDNPAPLDEIKPEHIRQYYQWRGNAPVAANREIALFSHIWTMCSPAEWNYTEKPNPAKGIKKNKEKPRDVYIENHLYDILRRHADQEIRDAMDIAYLIGQRPADVLKIHTAHIKDGVLSVTQNKTKAKLRFTVTGHLKTIIERRVVNRNGYLITNSKGGKMTVDTMERRFAKARAEAMAANPDFAEEIKTYQFRDLRAKTGTDIYLKTNNREAAQKQLGHASSDMTNRYIRRDTELSPLEFCGTPAKDAEHTEGE